MWGYAGGGGGGGGGKHACVSNLGSILVSAVSMCLALRTKPKRFIALSTFTTVALQCLPQNDNNSH